MSSIVSRLSSREGTGYPSVMRTIIALLVLTVALLHAADLAVPIHLERLTNAEVVARGRSSAG